MPNKFIPPQTDTATRTSSTPLDGEIFYDTDEKQLYYGDGTTLGGLSLVGLNRGLISTTSITTSFTIPASSSTQTQEFNDASWISVGGTVLFSDGTNYAYLEVTAKSTNTLTLKNTWDQFNGTTIAIGGTLSPSGTPATDGVDGLSAYEIAVGNGFVGTEGDWLASLVGDVGATGAGSLVPTDIKTANYTAVSGDLVPCDTSSGTFNLTAPTTGDIFGWHDVIGNAPTEGFGVVGKALVVYPRSGTTINGGTTYTSDVGAVTRVARLIGTDWRVSNG